MFFLDKKWQLTPSFDGVSGLCFERFSRINAIK
jgi:hypothetical protein